MAAQIVRLTKTSILNINGGNIIGTIIAEGESYINFNHNFTTAGSIQGLSNITVSGKANQETNFTVTHPVEFNILRITADAKLTVAPGITLTGRTIDIYGLVLRGNEEIEANTLDFLKQKNITVKQQNDVIEFTGPFDLVQSEVESFKHHCDLLSFTYIMQATSLAPELVQEVLLFSPCFDSSDTSNIRRMEINSALKPDVPSQKNRHKRFE